jgi:hypothetical protein
VPYEAAARTLTESQERFSTQLKRDGLAITMEHNFMMSEEGRKNFYYRLMQVSMAAQNLRTRTRTAVHAPRPRA